MPGAAYCPNCSFNFVGAQYSATDQQVETKREKHYRIFLIVIAALFIFDGIFWRIVQKLGDTIGYEIYDTVKPYTWLVSPIFASIPAVIGFLLPKTTPWRLIFIIGGSLWFVFRMFEFIQQQFTSNDFVFFEF